MRKRWFGALLLAACLGRSAFAADHRDGPGTLADPTVDITDVYAWMSADGNKVYLIMDLQGANTGATTATKFSNTSLYAFHIASGAGYGNVKSAESLVVCRFDNAATQGLECWGPSKEYVKDSVGNKTGKASTSGKMKVAALVRNDPFWFNIRGFLATASTVKAAAGALSFDPAGCPMLDMNTSSLLVRTIQGDGTTAMGPASDDFAKSGKAPVASQDPSAVTNGNVLSIVVAIDKSLLTTSGSLLSVWGSTNKQ